MNEADEEAGEEVHCRIGSSEKDTVCILGFLGVHCRIGSSEMGNLLLVVRVDVHWRTGS